MTIWTWEKCGWERDVLRRAIELGYVTVENEPHHLAKLCVAVLSDSLAPDAMFEELLTQLQISGELSRLSVRAINAALAVLRGQPVAA